MIEKGVDYPVYGSEGEESTLLARKALVSYTYEQLLELANVMYYVNKKLAGKWFGGIRLDEKKRALHKGIHDAAVNCCLSLEEMDRFEATGGSKQ